MEYPLCNSIEVGKWWSSGVLIFGTMELQIEFCFSKVMVIGPKSCVQFLLYGLYSISWLSYSVMSIFWNIGCRSKFSLELNF